MPPTVAFAAAAAASSSDPDAQERRVEAALPNVPPALLCKMFPQATQLTLHPACHSTPLHSTPLSFLHRAARAQIFSAQADFFSRFLGDAEAGSAAQLAQRVLAVTFGSTAGLKPELPKPPEEKKTTAGQLAIDRKNILSRVDEAMSGWEELVGEGDEGEGGDSPSQLEVRDAVVEEMKRTVRWWLESGEAREARSVEMAAMLETLHEWLLSLVDEIADAKAATAAELAGTTDAPAQAGFVWTRAPEPLVSEERVEAQERRAELSEKHTGAVLSTITDQQHRLRELVRCD